MAAHTQNSEAQLCPSFEGTLSLNVLVAVRL